MNPWIWNPRRRKVSLYIFHLFMLYKVFQRFLTRVSGYALTQNKNIISAHQNTFASQEPTEDACYACLQATINQNVNYHGQGWPIILSLKTPPHTHTLRAGCWLPLDVAWQTQRLQITHYPKTQISSLLIVSREISPLFNTRKRYRFYISSMILENK